jgi:hypothetical protein
MSELEQAVKLVRESRMAVWEQMAKHMKNHHVLAVELFRTDQDQTVAVFTIVKDGRPVQQVLQGDARGMRVRPVMPRDNHCHVPIWKELEATVMSTLMMSTAVAAELPADGDEGAAYSIALGQPPPKQPPEPGVTAVGGVMLASAFDVGEQVTGD